MVVASGYMEVNGIHNVGKIVSELSSRAIGINDTAGERIVFLMERESIDIIRADIASLRDLADVKSVHLTYYSVEHR